MNEMERHCRSRLGRSTLLLGLPCACLLAGCLYQGTAQATELSTIRDQPGWTLVDRVPLVKQEEEHDCGAAAVSALLHYWGRPMTPEQVRQATATPEGESIRAGALRDALHELGYAAFIVKGRFDDLIQHLQRGRPVLVGMLKPYIGDKRVAHYEVVVAYHPAQGVVTMDPGAGYRRYPIDGFEDEWAPTGRLALVAAPAGAPQGD